MLWFGRELRFTVGSIVLDPVEEKSKHYVNYVKKLRNQIRLAYEVTREALRKRAVQRKSIMIGT